MKRLLSRRGAGGRRAFAVAALAVLAGCSYSTLIRGRLSGSDGDTSTTCAVEVFDVRFTDPFRECRVDLTMGEAFTCRVSANVSQVYRLEVVCPGYDRVVRQVPVESCAGKWFSACDEPDVGTLALTRLR